MKMHTTQRLLAMALALVMLLPLISVPVFAEEPTVYWSNDFDGIGDLSTWLSTMPTTTRLYDNGGNTAIGFDIKGVAHADHTAKYYAYASRKVYAVTGLTENTNGTISGSFEVNGTTYSFTNQSVDKGTYITTTPASTAYRLYTPEMVDAMDGTLNVAKAVRVKNTAISYSASATKVAFEMRLFFPQGSAARDMAGRIAASDGKNVELYGIKVSADTVTIKLHENGTMLSGTTVNVPTGKWFTLTTVVDTANVQYEIYVNHVYAFTATNKSNSPSANFGFQAGKWDVLQTNRNNSSAVQLAGYVMMDDLKIYDGTNYVGQPAPEKGFEDFEDYKFGSKVTTAYGFNGAHAADLVNYNKVLADTDGNQFLRIPVLWDGVLNKNGSDYNGGTTNYDKSLMPDFPAVTLADDYLLLDMSYRLHGKETATANTVEVQLRNFNFDLTADVSTRTPRGGTSATVTENETQIAGIYLSLFQINMGTGAITSSIANVQRAPGASNLPQDEWFSIRYILDLKNVIAYIYINDSLYATLRNFSVTDSAWASCTGASNITVPANKIIVTKVNKTKGAFKLDTEANEDYSNVNYVDIDNINIQTKTLAEMDAEFDPSLYAGIISTEGKVSIRLNAPAGMRFATKIDTDKLDALYALADAGKIGEVEFGTLIVPHDYLNDTVSLTFDSLEAAGKNYLKIPSTYGRYYNGNIDTDPTTTHYVGSIVAILDENLTRDFAATGYVKVTLFSGAVYYYYSNTACIANVQSKAGSVMETVDMSDWSNSSKKIIEAYSKAQSFAEMYAGDLQGLDVLALGDSLFSGNDTTLGLDGDVMYDRSSQWINALGQKYNWNLTNLGIGGMTVSYQEDVNYLTKGKKASMYHWLMNNINEYHWNVQDESLLFTETNKYQYYTNSQGTRCTYNTYFQIGSFEGKTNADVDLIILEGGCNDYGTEIAAPLGEIGSTDGSTFIGAYNAIAQRLSEMYPNAKIVFLTTWYLGNQSRPDNVTSMEYSTSVNRLYDAYYADDAQFHLIDAGNPAVSSIDMRNASFRAEYCIKPTDSYHLNNKGMAIMEKIMTPFVWEYWVNKKTH